MKWATQIWLLVGLVDAALFRANMTFRQPAPEEDGVVDDVVDDIMPMQACSCDCCSTVERPPEEVVKFADGNSLKYKCYPPQQTDMCPLTCKASNADEVLTAAVVTMDYTRYCLYKCKPSAKISGTSCVRLTAKEVSQTVEETGNGDADVNFPTPLLPPTETFAPSIEDKIKAKEEKVKEEKAAAAAETHVKWDLRKLIAQRLRAEAGADMARGAAAEERVHTDLYYTQMAAQLTQKVAQALAPIAGKGQESQVATAAEAETANEEADGVQEIVNEAVNEAKTVVVEAKKIVVGEIKKEAAAAAKQEAEADAYMRAWDKPDNWGKVLAVRAASPYLKQMVAAISRVSEYEGFAKGLLAQAKGAQGQAQMLAIHKNQMQAQGDLIGAAQEANKVKILINKANGLQKAANKYWTIADDTRKSIPEWQIAGTKAAARAAWEFKVSFTPPPEEKKDF